MSVRLGTTDEYPTEAHLKPLLQKLVFDINTGADPRREIPLEFIIDRYIAEERLEEIKAGRDGADGHLHYSTACGYLWVLNRYIRPRWGRVPVVGIRASAIQDWLNALPLAPKSKAHIRGLMHQLLEKAMLWDCVTLEHNPVRLVRVRDASKRQRIPTVLTAEQFQQIVDRLPRCHRTMVIVAQCTGLRVSELLGLQWSDIDFGTLTMHVKRAVVNGRVGAVKTEYSKDLLPLAADVAVLLRDWRHEAPLSPEGWVFANPRTLKPYRGASIEKCYFRRISRKLGIKLGWHTFRHTYRSWLDATGAPVGVQQKLMRHAHISTTMNIYGNSLMQSKRDANDKVVDMALNAMPEPPSPLAA